MRTRSLLWLGILCALLMVGCGQKGPLRLPDKPAEPTVSPAPAEAATQNDPTELSQRRANPHE